MRDDGRVGEQHAAYRKGLVIGLTMAEVGILIIFVLLLLIGYQETRYVRLSRDLAALQDGQDGKQVVDSQRMAELKDAEGRLGELAQALGIKVTRPADDFRKLVRVVQAASNTAEGRQQLAEADRALEEIRAAAQQMRQLAAAGSSDQLAKQAEVQSFRIANQEGQLKRYEKQLETSGQGKGERPCWVERDGTIDYLYDVALGSNGIRMRERFYPERTQERDNLPMSPVDPSEEISEAEFLRRTDALYRYSQTLNCRFFVIVYDETGSQEKPLYKSELRTVEGHFYKLLSTESAPF